MLHSPGTEVPQAAPRNENSKSPSNFPQFDTADDAGMAAIRSVVGRSIKERVEYAGRIIALGNGKFSFSPARKGTRDLSDPGPKVAGRINVGTYHTHGGEFLDT